MSPDLANYAAAQLDAMRALWDAAADAEARATSACPCHNDGRYCDGFEDAIDAAAATHDPELPARQQRRLRPRRT